MIKFLLFFLSWVGMWAPVWGVELVGQPEVSVSGNKATLSWKTDVACGTRIQYGLSAEKLDLKVEGGVTDAHVIELTDLQGGQTYHYRLGSARQKFYTGSFATSSAVASAEKTTEVPNKKSVLDKVIGLFTPEVKPVQTSPSGSAQLRAPPTRETWGRMETLQDHYIRHGPDFGSRNAEDYAAGAWFLLQRAKKGELPMKWDDADATLRVFDPKTRAFAAYNRDGTAKTYFRPNSPSYWQRQPGKPIRANELSF